LWIATSGSKMPANGMFGRNRDDGASSITQRGLTLLNDAKQRDAIVLFDRALALEPDYVPALIAKGNALVAIDRQADAIACYDRVLARSPADGKAHFNRGCALVNLYRMLSPAAPPEAPFEEAIAAFESAERYGHPKAGAVLTVLRQFAELAAMNTGSSAESPNRAIVLVPDS